MKTYAKTKELDPIGGAGGGAPAAPPGSANDKYSNIIQLISCPFILYLHSFRDADYSLMEL